MIICDGKIMTVKDLYHVLLRDIFGQGMKRPRRFPGICKAAEELGVRREHLYMVLVGKRHSPRIEATPIFNKLRDS